MRVSSRWITATLLFGILKSAGLVAAGVFVAAALVAVALLFLAGNASVPAPAQAQTATTWTGIAPNDLAIGDTCRILFVTSAAVDPDDRDNLTQWDEGVPAVADDRTEFSGITFQILDSNSSVHARYHTNTDPNSDGDGEPIYHYKGARLADSYAGLYPSSGGWLSQGWRNEKGEVVSVDKVWTGAAKSGACKGSTHLAGGIVTYGRKVSGSEGDAGDLSDGAKTTSELQSPVDYSSIYSSWNVDVHGTSDADAPWDSGSATQYPVLQHSGFDPAAQRANWVPSPRSAPTASRVGSGTVQVGIR